jgi:hypothetical protein
MTCTIKLVALLEDTSEPAIIAVFGVSGPDVVGAIVGVPSMARI